MKKKALKKNLTRSRISARAGLFWPCSDQPESGLCWSSRAGDVPRDFRAVWFNLSLRLERLKTAKLYQRLLRKKAALPLSCTAGNPGNVSGKFFGFGRYVHWDLIIVQPD